MRRLGAPHSLQRYRNRGALLDVEPVEEGVLVGGQLHGDPATDYREGICRHGEGRKVRGIAGGDEGCLHLHVSCFVQPNCVIRWHREDLVLGETGVAFRFDSGELFGGGTCIMLGNSLREVF